MPSHRILRAMLTPALLAGCCLLLVVAQGCGGGAAPAAGTSPHQEAKPQTNVTEPTDTAKAEQSQPSKQDTASETAPAGQDSSQVDAVVAVARASAQANNPALGTLEVLKVKIEDSWARVDMQPKDKSTDAASWLLRSSGGSWTVVDFGTSIVPEDYPAAPAEVFQ